MVQRRSRRGCNGCHRSTQRLDDESGRDVLGTTIDDVELLVLLIVVRLRVGVVIDDLDHPLGVLQLHLFLIVTLMGNV
jgi:hypothetical protein